MKQDRWVTVLEPVGAMVIVPTPRDLTTRHRQRDAALDGVPVDVGALAAAWVRGVWQEGADFVRRQNPEDEQHVLEKHRDILQSQLNDLNKRLDELTAQETQAK